MEGFVIWARHHGDDVVASVSGVTFCQTGGLMDSWCEEVTTGGTQTSGGSTTAQYEPGSGAHPQGCIPTQLKGVYVPLGSQVSQTGRYGNSNTFRKCVNSPTTDRWTCFSCWHEEMSSLPSQQ